MALQGLLRLRPDLSAVHLSLPPFHARSASGHDHTVMPASGPLPPGDPSRTPSSRVLLILPLRFYIIPIVPQRARARALHA